MKRYLLDTGIAGDFIDRRRGVFERAREESIRGNRIGIGTPVLAELVYGIEGSASREKNMQAHLLDQVLGLLSRRGHVPPMQHFPAKIENGCY